MPERVVITGDSHAMALRQGWNQLVEEGAADIADWIVESLGNGFFTRRPFAALEDGAIRFTHPDYVESYRALGLPPIGREKDVLFGFSISLNVAPAFSDPMWRDWAGWELAGRHGLRPVYTDSMPDVLAAMWEHSRRFFEMCQDLGTRYFVIAGPPPKRSHPCLEEGTHPDVVQDVFRQYHSAVEAWHRANGTEVFCSYSWSTDESGFLKPEFCHPHPRDSIHANQHYGAVFMRRIADAVRSCPR